MNEVTYRKLNPTEAMFQALPKLVEAFVIYYGEESRKDIEDKFKNILFIGHSKPGDITGIIRDDLEKKSQDLIDEFIAKIKISPDKKNEFKDICFDGTGLEHVGLLPINQYIKYIEGNSNNRKAAVRFINKIYPEVTEENIDEFIRNGNLRKFDFVVREYNQIVEQYCKYKEEFKSYQDYVERCDVLRKQLEKSYLKILLEDFKYLFTEEELKQIDSEFNNSEYGFLRTVNKKTECYFGYQLESEALIDAFSIESEQLMITGSKWKKKSVIEDRISYFKNIGINLGDDYQDYLNNIEVNQLLPKLQELAEKFIKRREALSELMMNEYYQSIEEFQNNARRLEQMGFLNQYYEYDARTYETNGTYVAANLKKTSEGYMFVPLLCLSLGGVKEYLDHMLVHELNHVYELSYQSFDNEHFYGICGWDLISGRMKKEVSNVEVVNDDDDQKRKYELFNEIINEIISQEITEILFSIDGHIFNTKENAKIRGGTSYEHMMFLIKNFYETYKKEIIASRRNGNLDKLISVVGKENFEALNNLFHEYYEHFSGYRFYSLMDSLGKNEVTEQTKKFNAIKSKRDQIMMAMEEYNKNSRHVL